MPRRQADLNQKSVCRKNQNRGRPDSRIANAWFAEHDPEGVAFLSWCALPGLQRHQ
jgi:hypothetical protein